jgi:hypothetical protein
LNIASLKVRRGASNVLWFLSILLIGSDRFSFDIFGLTIRYVAGLLAIIWLAVFISKPAGLFSRTYISTVAILVFGALLSLPTSHDLPMSAAYSVWLIFNVFVIGGVFHFFVVRAGITRSFQFWLSAYRLQCVLVFIEFIWSHVTGDFGIWGRPYLWFFEPSYASIYFSGYFGLALFLNLNNSIHKRPMDLLDLLLATTVLLLLGSATGAMVMLIAVVVALIIKNPVKGTVYAISGVAILGFALRFPSEESLMFGFLSNMFANYEDSFSILMARSGSRVIRFFWGIETFFEYPYFGIGLGADKTFMLTSPIPEFTNSFSTPYNDAVGAGFVNPFVEVAATTGMVGLVGLLTIVGRLWWFTGGIANSSREKLLAKSAIFGITTMIISLMLEGSFLRFYLWSYIGFAIGCNSSIKMCFRSRESHMGPIK